LKQKISKDVKKHITDNKLIMNDLRKLYAVRIKKKLLKSHLFVSFVTTYF